VFAEEAATQLGVDKEEVVRGDLWLSADARNCGGMDVIYSPGEYQFACEFDQVQGGRD